MEISKERNFKELLRQYGFRQLKSYPRTYQKDYKVTGFKIHIIANLGMNWFFPQINNKTCKKALRVNEKNINYWNDYFYQLQQFDRKYHNKETINKRFKLR